jgi:hypothetical protein
MRSHPLRTGFVVSSSAVAVLAGSAIPGALAVSRDVRAPNNAAASAHCSAGAHTLSTFGDRVYPETGNGGFRSLHTGVHMVYDATRNRFLTGNHVVLTDRATHCLRSFSLDFERHSANHADGPKLHVRSVQVNGHPATFHFVRPTFPGDPRGQNDPRPRAHQASQTDPVGGPHHNPLPPACSPELLPGMSDNALNGTRCPANKLVITPRQPLPRGARFTVRVDYTGRPGLHNDGDSSTEGWFRATSGSFVTTEPVGTEDWMPLNDHPTAKPTYDFFDTVNAGKTALANGNLVSKHSHAADSQFPGGSTTWHWHSPAPIASYLVESSVGDYHLTERTASNGVRFYEAQDTSIPAARQKHNLAVMDKQENVTKFESRFSGPYPFTSDGVVVGTPQASFEEEMQTMITFAGGQIDLDLLYHENMHQWWGDNVSEGSYSMTFFKEGLATLGEFLFAARLAKARAGGSSPAGRKAFHASLVNQFDATYAVAGSFWTGAPSNPTSATLFSNESTYQRPGATYIALRQILGRRNFARALRQIQTRYGGRSITEPQLEAAFRHRLPVHSSGCDQRLREFFHQWFDRAYPAGGGRHRPRITGPGLAGHGFYTTAGCQKA